MSEGGTILETLYGECDGMLELRALGAKKLRQFFALNDLAGIKQFIHSNRAADLYFAVSTRDGKGGAKENIVSIPAVWIDIDYKSVPGGEQEALRILDEFPLQPTVRVGSGGGCHGYWKLKEPCTKEDIPQLEAIMRGLAARLHGDPACCEVGRILRIPNTTNHKYKPPRPVVMTHCNGTEFSLSDFDPFVDDDVQPSAKSSSAPAGHPHLDRIMACKFMQHCRDDAVTLPEPHWRAMITQLVRETGGKSLIHELSKPHQGYKKSATDKKILDALDGPGPQTCQTIKTMWPCGLKCSVKSPAGLAYRLAECHLRDDATNAPFATNATNATNVPDAPECNRDATEMQPGMQLAGDSKTVLSDALIVKVREWLDFCDGSFSLTELAQELQLYKNTSAYNTLKSILKRLVDSQTIERVGDRRGVYRKIEHDLAEMNWWEAPNEEYDLELPLDLSALCRIYPRNIIVIAGENNAAKTLLSLYIAKMNAHRLNVRYFNSEMDPTELRNRLFSFDNTPVELWQRIHFYSRSQNFHQCVFPDDLNIIDFLEIHDEYYKVGGWIRQIHERLNNGIAVINLQKKPGSDTGRGGEVTTEKARLYISLIKMLDHLQRPYTRAKIIKCKAPRDPRHHPYHWVRDFRVHRGWDIETTSEWGPEVKPNESEKRKYGHN